MLSGWFSEGGLPVSKLRERPMRIRSLESQDRRVARSSECETRSVVSGGPGTSNDHFQSPKYFTRIDRGVVIHGFIMNSGQRSASGSSSCPLTRLDVIV